MTFEKTEIWGFEHAIRGMRNPLESWNKSDSYNDGKNFIIGENDIQLMQKLIRAGSEHRKFMRQIFVSVDITAPLYWWKEFDTYKIGTVANSTSTMHKLASTPITFDCFEMDDFQNVIIADYADELRENEKDENDYKFYSYDIWKQQIEYLEMIRNKYLETKDIRFWKELIRLLPESWLQTRTVSMSYENILNIIRQRKSHKLSEWKTSFICWAYQLPYADELFLGE
ncbi:MAG: hypothetical protein MJ174_07510 [Treponema sp.]|nr:hypothetical protein [Treponema sp.]